MELSDVFVVHVGVQFEKGSFINRNRIKTQMGARWLTAPVKLKGYMKGSIADMALDNTNWRKKHLNRIQGAYRNAPRFEENFPKLEKHYQALPHKTLLTACLANIGFWVQEYGISVKLRPNMLSVVKTEALVKMCQDANVDTYLSGPLGRNYLDEDAFKKAGIEVRYHDYQMQPYPQLWGDFIPNLSVLDCWFNQEELP